MKKYSVIGNPINHSLSPKIHNFWIKKNNIDAIYNKKKLQENDIENFINEIKIGNITGLNVTVPFKKKVIPYLDKLSPEAEQTQSVNTIILKNKATLIFEDFLFRCSIGKKRLVKKKIEGDKKTPIGTFSLGNLYYRKDRHAKPETKLKCIPINETMGWCDDIKNKKN